MTRTARSSDRVRLVLALILMATPALAETSAQHRERRPELFHPDTGLRIARQRAPTPDDVPGAVRVTATQVRAMTRTGAILLDVGAAAQSRYDDLDGTWLVRGQHLSLPGATWLPEVGRGTLTETMSAYLTANIERLTGGDRTRPVIVFCIADCWMSWNAAQRLTSMGYTNVHWFAEGTDGWTDQGWDLAPVDPVPVEID